MTKVLFHVGTPKSGTSGLQDLLFRNREALRAAGILYPAERFDAHFLAALDLLEMPWGGLENQALGAWDELAAQVRAHNGTVIISHEIFATATRAHVARALASLGDAEVHLVLSVRDLARQIPAEWQENVKHRRVLTYRRFLRQIQDSSSTSTVGAWFAAVQDVPAIIDRWAATLPAANVHIVTVPPSGSGEEALMERFFEAFGLSDVVLDRSIERANPSMGAPETTFVRRLNVRVNHGVLANEHYRELVREVGVHRGLAQRASVRIGLPPQARAWAVDQARRWIDFLTVGGYTIHGNLDDLLPAPADPQAMARPDKAKNKDLLAAATDALVVTLVHAAQLRDEVETLRRERDEAVERADAVGAVEGAKRTLVRNSRDNRALSVGLRAYRKLRRR